jgi:hypothetical protein
MQKLPPHEVVESEWPELVCTSCPRARCISGRQRELGLIEHGQLDLPAHGSYVSLFEDQPGGNLPTISQSNSSPISWMQTGLCRMRTESLAAAFSAHRETDFGRQRRKAPNHLCAVFIRGRDRMRGI